MKHATLTAEPRTILGKKVERLRRVGKVPGNIYGHNVPSQSITLDAHDFGLLYRHLMPNTIVDVSLDGESRPVLLDRAVTDPRTGRIIHVELKQVNLREKVHATVAVVGVGQSEMMVRGDGILLQALDSIEVRALPDDLPGSIEADLSVLVDFHAAIHVRDLSLDHDTVELLTSGDELVFKLATPQVRDEESEAQVEAETAEAEEQSATAEPAGE